MKKTHLLISALAIGLLACQKNPAMAQETNVKEDVYGKMPDGREVKIYTLTNKNGLTAKVTEYGAILVSMETPDKDGKVADITHGYDTLAGWLTNTSYFGATVGRFGNRIKDGKFSLDGKEYTLATNNDPGGIPCALHGGIKGFDKVVWDGEVTDDGVRFTYVSKDGEEGYPGKLTVDVTYSLNDENELKWTAKATTDAPTVLNIVQHTYWNLSGDPTKTILDEVLTLNADHYLPTDKGLIPTGEVAPVKGTPMDFTEPTVIGKRVDDKFEALEFGGGYDHAWVLNGKGKGLHPAATVKDPDSGRVMSISTNQPAIQFYCGNFLDGSATGKGGVKYAYRTALALETEGFPDAPNNPKAPSAVLRPGEIYEHNMVFKFSAE
jgi:aldose 1-epimerase